MNWLTPAILVLTVVFLASVLYAGWTRRRLAVAFLGGTGVIALLWALALTAIRTAGLTAGRTAPFCRTALERCT
jgi:hypothetical protein